MRNIRQNQIKIYSLKQIACAHPKYQGPDSMGKPMDHHTFIAERALMIEHCTNFGPRIFFLKTTLTGKLATFELRSEDQLADGITFLINLNFFFIFIRVPCFYNRECSCFECRTLEYLRVKENNVCNFLSNGLKIYI